MKKIGVLLNNIGSPNSASPTDVKKFLAQFLMDEDVISLPWLFRFILVRGIIVPLRGYSSAEKYKKIWFKEGSPLIVHTRRFAQRLQESLGEAYHVELGMRYGTPSIEGAMEKFKEEGVEKVIFAPLYPQYAAATTMASQKEFKRVVRELKLKSNFNPSSTDLNPFYEESFFQNFWISQLKDQLSRSWDHILFSFHGLPESQVRKTSGCLASANCCEQKERCALNCYRAQCFQTAYKIAEQTGLKKSDYTISFQSRLGRAKWIQPYTEATLKVLAQSGKKKILILSPAFVADCVETLEEIQLELREKFIDWGGQELSQISCPNDDLMYSTGFADHLRSLKI